MVRVASEGRASRAVARALGQLVERILALGPDRLGVVGGLDGVDATNPQLSGLRDALRQTAARSRDGALLCRVIEETLVLEGVPIDRQATINDPHLGLLLDRLLRLRVSSLTVREGAAPGELLTLGRLLAQSSVPRDPRTPARGNALISGETPTTVHAVSFADETPRELLRTWSVLVTPLVEERAAPARHADGTADFARPERPAVGAGSNTASILSRLSAARSDDAASGAVEALRELLDDCQRRGDAATVEGVARTCLLQMQQIGEAGGRLALEGAVRHLLRVPLLELLAAQLPYSSERTLLLQLFARAGDAGVALLVQQLLTTEDALSRRAYFDAIVAIDVGSSLLFDALHDSRWFVVRNAAALLGEMGVSHADDALILLLRHEDDRIRIAAARALMRLRTAKAMQALHAVITDGNAEVRRLSAAAFGLAGAAVGGGVRPPAARLAIALERETDDDVALEMLAALGRLGSADAVQRLLRIALPPSPDLTGDVTSRDSWVRIAALEALVRARGPQMQPVIESLASDADAEVAMAAASLRTRSG